MHRSKEFQQIIELVDLITKYKVRHIEVIGNSQKSESAPSKYRKFYDSVSDRETMNDSTAASLFSLTPEDRKYKRLREGLIGRLLNTLIFVDLSDSQEDDYQSNYYKALKEFAALNILRSKGARVSAIELAKKLLKKSIKFEFTFLIIEVSAILKRYYSINPEYHKQFGYYSELMWSNFDKRKYELQAYEACQRIQIPYSVSKTKNSKVLAQIDIDIKKFEGVSADKKSLSFYYYFYLIKMLKSMAAYDWEITTKTCREAISYFDKTVARERVRPFLSQMSLCLIMLKKYEEAEISIKKAIAQTTKNSTNWFKIHEVKVLLYFHSKNYDSAYRIFLKIQDHPRKQSISEPDKESWAVYEAYLNFLLLIGKVSKKPKDKEAEKKFRLSKTMNEVPIFSKDKRGMNVPIIIIHFLFLIYERKYDLADNRLDAIMKYYQRHLKADDQNYRSNCFLKMLECIRKGDFEKEKAASKAKIWKQKLESVEMNLFNQAHETEIIPYTDLWDLCLECLD